MTPHLAHTEHHALAATHHEHAAKFHRQASRHFESGKDPDHWAHQALVAHGHTLRAIESGSAARAYYQRQELSLSQHSDAVIRFPSNALETAEAMGSILRGTQRHAVAADHHEEAARHHARASKHCMARNYAPAAREALMACRHAQKSLYQSHEAAKQHIEAYFDLILPILLAPEKAGKAHHENA
jgi:hypothetical protein